MHFFWNIDLPSSATKTKTRTNKARRKVVTETEKLMETVYGTEIVHKPRLEKRQEQNDRTKKIQNLRLQERPLFKNYDSSDDDSERQSEEQHQLPNLSAVLLELQKVREENKRLQHKNKKTNPIPNAITTTAIDSTGGNSVITDTSSISGEQQEIIIKTKGMKEELEIQLTRYVKKYVFKDCKFHVSDDTDKKICRIAAFKNMVQLPVGVTRKVFGEHYYGVVHKRIKQLRNNCHAAAKWKFESKWNNHIVIPSYNH